MSDETLNKGLQFNLEICNLSVPFYLWRGMIVSSLRGDKELRDYVYKELGVHDHNYTCGGDLEPLRKWREY